MKYQPFLAHLSTKALHALDNLVRRETRDFPEYLAADVRVELESFACEIEARLQHHAAGIETFKLAGTNDAL